MEFSQGKEQGLNDGKKEGLEHYSQKCDEIVKKIWNCRFRNRTLFHYEFLLNLATAIAEQIVMREVVVDDTIFTELFKEALNKITDKEKIIIEVNPEDLEKVEQYRNQFAVKFKEFKQIDIKEKNATWWMYYRNKAWLYWWFNRNKTRVN